MSPRKSKTGVPYLQYDHGYLIYVHPKYIEKHGKPYRFAKGVSLKDAQQTAIEANIQNDNKRPARIVHESERFRHLINIYRRDFLPFKGYAEGSLNNAINQLNRLSKDLGDKVTLEITVRDIASYLDTEHINNAYVKHRGRLLDIFAYGLHKGLCTFNPAADTLPSNIKKTAPKQRQRLREEGFNKIYALADPWFKNAMDLAVLTLQARQEISCIRKKAGSHNIYYTDPPEWFLTSMKKILAGKDWTSDLEENHLYIIRGKTARSTDKAFIKIPVNSIPNLKAVISRCRDDIPSPYLIHRKPDKNRLGKKKHWTQVLPKYLSDEFSRLRDMTDLYDDLEPLEKPSFHEMRSYGADKLEETHGKAFVNWLLGHSKMKMSEHYLEGHKVRWTEVSESETGK